MMFSIGGGWKLYLGKGDRLLAGPQRLLSARRPPGGRAEAEEGQGEPALPKTATVEPSLSPWQRARRADVFAHISEKDSYVRTFRKTS